MGIDYYRVGDKVEIVIRDFSGRKLESFTCNMKDKKKYSEILNYLKEKYGLEPEIKSFEDMKKEGFAWWE